MKTIKPLEVLGSRLLGVEKPSRYLGGEYGSIVKEGGDLFTVALCFPDLYEIGMSNNALRILYGGLNALPGVRCERVFAPARDFEDLLATSGIPLYTLESGIPLHDADLLGFSIGYELAATNILAVLQSGGVPLDAELRGDSGPIVIAGGPAATNPHPYSSFLDAAYIGEAEESFYEIVARLARMKSAGARRNDLLGELASYSAIWMPARRGAEGKKAVRAVYSGFSSEQSRFSFPIPSVKVVQEHGTVEIMRGCPNGCRFCHAGFYYRPQRSKPQELIKKEVEALIRTGGYREITLASLSSGDYECISELLRSLNEEWSRKRISFQLPSLKVNTFTLPLLESISEVRKSGLTFAVETPCDDWQRSINKDVSYEQILSILKEARSRGFKQAKFYFMLGLPVSGSVDEEAGAILDFFARIFAAIDFQINVNVGTFVPKPHTPFQWSAQAGEESAMEAINTIRAGLRRYRNLKISYHSPFASLLEGIISRGDERVGRLIRRAFEAGARLDSWEDHLDRDLWRSVLASEKEWDPLSEATRERAIDQSLPWDDISVRVSKSFLKGEFTRAKNHLFTSACQENCTKPCGSCDDSSRIVNNCTQPEPALNTGSSYMPTEPHVVVGRVVVKYSKKGSARFLQHLSIVDAIGRSLQMIDAPVAFSEGFNPMPRIELNQPIPISVASLCEIASIMMVDRVDVADLARRLDERLPQGLRVEEARFYPIHPGQKIHTIGSLSWGGQYAIGTMDPGFRGGLLDLLGNLIEKNGILGARLDADGNGLAVLTLPDPVKKEHGLMRLLENCTDTRPIQAVFEITKLETLARGVGGPVPFFDAFAAM